MLFAIVSRGKSVGTRLVPHRFRDNRYHVQLGKEGPYIPVSDYREIPSHLKGIAVRKIRGNFAVITNRNIRPFFPQLDMVAVVPEPMRN